MAEPATFNVETAAQIVSALQETITRKNDEIERLRAALTSARTGMLAARDAAQHESDFGLASLLQTHINDLDRQVGGLLLI